MHKRSSRTKRLFSVLLALALASGAPAGAAQIATTKKLTEEQKIAHLLDRITYGARPGDVERVMKLGWEKYLEEQLRPDRISDQLVEDRLKNIETIHLSSAELAKIYPRPQVIKRALKERGVELPGQNQNEGQAGDS